MSTVVVPDFGAISDTDLASMIGALTTVALIVAVLMVVVCAVVWALASSGGNLQAVSRARMGLWTGLGAAVLAGAAQMYVDWLIDTGTLL